MSVGQDRLNPARSAASDAGTETHDGNAARAAPIVTKLKSAEGMQGRRQPALFLFGVLELRRVSLLSLPGLTRQSILLRE